eukprot:gene7405-8889_t
METGKWFSPLDRSRFALHVGKSWSEDRGAVPLIGCVEVVESPAKAKTINKYLGSDYEVLASFGHVRDLPAKNGS